MAKAYGYELILDLRGCNVAKFNRTDLRKFFRELCKLIDMKRGELHFWDDWRVPKAERQTRPETTGTSAVQFILTSSIVVHTLDLLGAAYVNLFSCKPFDQAATTLFVREWFEAQLCDVQLVERT